MSWTNPTNPFDTEISKALKDGKTIVAIATKSKAIPKPKKRKKTKRLITIFKVSKSGKIKPKLVSVDTETYRLIKANQNYRQKQKRIWLPKCVREDLMIKRYFS